MANSSLLEKLKTKGKTLKERITNFKPVEYRPTAVGYDKLTGNNTPKKADNRKLMEGASLLMSMGGKVLVNKTQCHEYLAMDSGHHGLDNLKERLNEHCSVIENELDDRISQQIGNMPSAFQIPNLLKRLSFFIWFLKAFLGFAAAIVYIFMVGSMFLVATFSDVITYKGTIEFLYTDLNFFFWAFSMLPVYFLVFWLLDRSGLPRLLDAKLPVTAALKRDTGMFRKVNGMDDFIDIPFDEMEAQSTTMWDGGNRSMSKLYLAHKYSKAGIIYGAPHKPAWYTGVLWEFFQHYMDVSRPLPDVPEFEPYRHLDPTTREWDKKHNRPERLWRDMDSETYMELVDASVEVAENYPYLAPHDAKNEGWKPAGEGKHWYQLG